MGVNESLGMKFPLLASASSKMLLHLAVERSSTRVVSNYGLVPIRKPLKQTINYYMCLNTLAMHIF